MKKRDPNYQQGIFAVYKKAEIEVEEILKVLTPQERNFIEIIKLSRLERGRMVLEIHLKLQETFGYTIADRNPRPKGGWSLDHTGALMKLSHGEMSYLIRLARGEKIDGREN